MSSLGHCYVETTRYCFSSGEITELGMCWTNNSIEIQAMNSRLDIVGSVYHLVTYMQSNKIHSVVLMSKFYSALFVSSTCFGPHRSIVRSVLYELYVQIWYVVLLCVLLDTSSRYKVCKC